MAARYGTDRATLRNQGSSLAPLDLLIAAHAVSADAGLVTNDQAFTQVPDLRPEDRTR